MTKPPWANPKRKRWTFEIEGTKKKLTDEELGKIKRFMCHPQVQWLMSFYKPEVPRNAGYIGQAPPVIGAVPEERPF